jgi:UDPglucose 6-dehydrogenase
MKLTVIGTGYVGLVTGACLADVGHNVLCVDVDESKIARLRRGEIPIYEPGLDQIVARCTNNGKLTFTSDLVEAAKYGMFQMIAVGTPPAEDGSADLKYVLAAAKTIGDHMDGDRIVINKSTVPVGTGDKVEKLIRETLAGRNVKHSVAVVSNPEFLKEGAAITDFMKPDRIIIGTEDPKADELMRELYAPFQRNHDRTITMSRRASELSKYAANAMLATRISFMNELAGLAEVVGVDIEQVRKGIGSDPRIGNSFLYSGTGYGGSCFPKDVTALMELAQKVGISLGVLNSVEEANHLQKHVIAKKCQNIFGDVAGMTFALWGLSFKPDTDDMREAPSLTIIEDLAAQGAKLQAFDPVVKSLNGMISDRAAKALRICDTAELALKGADALLVATEWRQFRSPDFEMLRDTLKRKTIVDGRNLYTPNVIAQFGLKYYGIGRGLAVPTKA